MELWQFLGDLHPKLVQFPLVLLLVGLLFDLAGLLGKKEALEAQGWARKAHGVAIAATAIGTIGLLFAFICGIYAEIWAGRSGIPQHPIELHELMANIASWGFVILLAWRIFLTADKRKQLAAYVTIGLIWYVLLGVTGWLGGQLVFEYGAGARGVAALGRSGLTVEDLNVLATRQTDENLRYSEWMHHVFGLMTLGLAASLLAQVAWPKAGPKLKWIVPAFLLAGGIFLFFMADRDLYALTDMRQWRDREVQLHKSLATIMTIIGAVGLIRLRGGNAKRETRNAKPEIETTNHDSRLTTHETRGSNSKLIAVMALIGGSMLFTHVHTVAPYANVAAGVYIAHVVMGLVALGIGGTRLLQDWMPVRGDGSDAQSLARRAAWRRGLGLAFGGLMAIEAVLLVTYNEGLPWYIGYGEYNRWGPGEHSASITVAPFGDFRAILMVDSHDATVFVAFRDRFTDESVAPKLDRLPVLLISRGNEETVIPLKQGVQQSEGEGANDKDWAGMLSQTNYRGEAEFLKSSLWLSARLVLLIDGKRRVGYFDPWVEQTINPVPPNEKALYQCPMHEGIRSTTPGECPLCHMELVPIQAPRLPGVLHDAGYELRVTPAERKTGAMEADFMLQPVKDGATLTKLAITHEQLIHLIVVSEDLAYFDHVHPVESTDERMKGYFEWRYTFPRVGRYVMYADLTPTGAPAQVFRVPLRVDEKGVTVETESEGARGASGMLAVDDGQAKLVRSMLAGKTPQDSCALDKSVENAVAQRAPATGRAATLPAAPEKPDLEVEMIPQPGAIYAGLHTTLLFRLSDISFGKRELVTNLLPYLGAAGHCVIVSEDTGVYVHCHPQEMLAPVNGEKFGPEVAFHAVFPKPGRYRVWGQFKMPGKAGAPDRMVIADFTVNVKQPWVPAAWVNYLLNE